MTLYCQILNIYFGTNFIEIGVSLIFQAGVNGVAVNRAGIK